MFTSNNGNGGMTTQQMQQQIQQMQQQMQNVSSMNGGGASQTGGHHGGSMTSSFSRRVSAVGGIDRRSSMAPLPLDASMSEIFGRRTGTSLDAMDILGRRDSMESTTAVLDACILDLTRRRLSMAMGVTQNSIGLGSNDMSYGGGASGSVNLGSSSSSNLLQSQSHASSLAARQQQLQQQQYELEKRQKELELQRQQLLAGLQETSMQAAVQGLPLQQNISMGNCAMGSNFNMNNQAAAITNQDSKPRQQWWVCQICNTKAFASRDEAMHHEMVCTTGPRSSQLAQPDRNSQNHAFASTQENQHHLLRQMSSGSSNSNGPFAIMPQPLSLSMPSDKDWLTPLHCFVRRHCVEVFCATNDEVATPSKGKRKPIQVGQVGIRCPHCHFAPNAGQRERGSVYYPTTISSIYNATMNLLQRHLHSCTAVPDDIMRRYQTLKADDARSGTSKKYWVESALSLGLVDTPSGIRFSALRPPPLPRMSRQQHSTADRRNSNEFFSSQSNAVAEASNTMERDNEVQESTDISECAAVSAEETTCQSGKELSHSAPLVTPEDKPYATGFSYHLLSQMQPCVFTEADRLGKRKGLPAGFAGLACRHCFGGYGSGRFFPSSIKTLSDTSKTLNVLHNHMMRCRKCPQDVRETLEKLRVHHDDERAKMKFGSQKAFFAKIWGRLHDGSAGSQAGGMKRKLASSYAQRGEVPMKRAMMSGPIQMNQLSGMQGNSMLAGLDVLSRQAVDMGMKRHRTGL